MALRYEIWIREHVTLEMVLKISPAGIVMPPYPTGVSDPAALQDVQNKKKQLEHLGRSRKSDRNLADGSQITVEGT